MSAAPLRAVRLRPVVDRTFAFEEADQAFAALRGGRHFGKLVVRGV